jgi:hypothetical protein
MPIEQKTIVGKCFIIYVNRMIYLSCYVIQRIISSRAVWTGSLIFKVVNLPQCYCWHCL